MSPTARKLFPSVTVCLPADLGPRDSRRIAVRGVQSPFSMAFSKWICATLWMKIHAFPRVELHVHLDGSIDSEDLFTICKARNLTLPTGLPQNISDVQHYVEGFSGWHRFDAVNEIIGGDVASIRQAAEAFVDFQAKSGVKYTEVRYDPVRLSRSRLGNVSISEEDAVKAVQEGLMIGSRRHKIHVYQILCAMRGASPQQCFSTANLALRLASQDLGGVVGLDLAGDETDFPNAAYVDCMRHAKLAGLNVTVHSGEFNTSQTNDVRSAVFSMLADRVGHGYAAAQDVELLRELTRRGIHLEACPNSAKRHGAWALKAIESFREHHALFGLNTDDPAPLFGNTTAAADEDIVEGLHFSKEDIHRSYAAAFHARFGGRVSRGVKSLELRSIYV